MSPVKCPHGVYLAGESSARYCSACNPELRASPVKFNKRSQEPRPSVKSSRERKEGLDAAEYLSLPANVRIATYEWE